METGEKACRFKLNLGLFFLEKTQRLFHWRADTKEILNKGLEKWPQKEDMIETYKIMQGIDSHENK